MFKSNERGGLFIVVRFVCFLVCMDFSLWYFLFDCVFKKINKFKKFEFMCFRGRLVNFIYIGKVRSIR